MAENLIENNRRCCRPWPLTIRGWLVLISSTVIGLSFWIIERDWYWGALAAISLCIIFGLLAQVHDLWKDFRGSETWTSEERWARRFTITWRLVVICLIAASFLVRLLVKWKILDLNTGRDYFSLSLCGIHDAVLLTAIIIAIASSPCLMKRMERRKWSWVLDLLGGVAACALCTIFAMDQALVPVLVHITISGIEMAGSPQFSSEALAVYNPARLAWFFDITTMGVISVLSSCILLRLLSLLWWRRILWRVCLGVLLAASLTAMIVLSERIAFVEIPAISPALAAEISMPRAHLLVASAVLVLLLISAIARRWSELPTRLGGTENHSWRRDESRYYHERRILLLPLAVVLLISLVRGCIDWPWYTLMWSLADWIESPQTCLSVALIVLVMQITFSGDRKCFDATLEPRPRLAPGLFWLIWLVLLAIVVSLVLVFDAWGFALWFKQG
jgi:hypothetical protein